MQYERNIIEDLLLQQKRSLERSIFKGLYTEEKGIPPMSLDKLRKNKELYDMLRGKMSDPDFSEK